MSSILPERIQNILNRECSALHVAKMAAKANPSSALLRAVEARHRRLAIACDAFGLEYERVDEPERGLAVS